MQAARELLPGVREIIDLRDQTVGLRRAIDLLSSETKNALEFEIALQGERQAKLSHQMNVSAHRLNILAAVFFPLVTLTGIFGMNLNSGIVRALGEKPAFWLVLSAGVLIGVCLYALISRRAQVQTEAS